MDTSNIIYESSVPVASNYVGGMPGKLRIAQFNGGSSIVEISVPGTSSMIHAHAAEIREFGAKLIAAADACDSLAEQERAA